MKQELLQCSTVKNVYSDKPASLLLGIRATASPKESGFATTAYVGCTNNPRVEYAQLFVFVFLRPKQCHNLSK